ncbi:MAG: hypothetical protein WC775_03075 [Patescibacteria group bacterium]|jgi:triacylglycerol esterase/lipase EstA (alpha/beta hydrolase family)
MFIDLLKEYVLIAQLHARALKIKTPPLAWKEGKKNPVLLFPGLSETFVSLLQLANFIHKLGHPIYVPSLLNTFNKIKDLADTYANFIMENKLDNIVCISHSKGGVVAKYLMDNFPEINQRIKLSVSLSTPYQGSVFGYLYINSLSELIPNSAAIRKCMQCTENNGKIFALYPEFDNHVLPNRNLQLPQATNIKINVVGHTRILTAEETFKTVKNILEA